MVFGRRVLVLVVLVMFVLQCLVDVLIFVALGNIQPDSYEHKKPRRPEGPIWSALSEGERGAHEWGSSKIATCSRSRDGGEPERTV